MSVFLPYERADFTTLGLIPRPAWRVTYPFTLLPDGTLVAGKPTCEEVEVCGEPMAVMTVTRPVRIGEN